MIRGASVVNFTTNYNPTESAKKYVVRESIGGSVALINNSPVTIFESVSKHYKYSSTVEQSVDKSSSDFTAFDIGGSATVSYGENLLFENFMASVTVNTNYQQSWNSSVSTHDYRRFTNEQEMNSTKQVTVPPFTSTIVDFTAKSMRHPSVNYVTYVKITHATLNQTQIFAMLDGQGISKTCVIETNDVLCKISGSMSIDASLGLDFEAIGTNLNQTSNSDKDEL